MISSPIADVLDTYRAELGLVILAIMFVAFIRERYPATVVAVLGICAFLATGLLDSRSLVQSFSNPAPITIGAMFILSAALMRTGTLDLIGNWIVARAREHPVRATIELTVGLLFAAAFMNNTPVVVIMIPIVLRLAGAINVSAKKLLIPLSYVSMLSGTLTLVGTSTNLLVDGVAREEGLAPFGIFEITPVGIVVAIVGTIALVVFSRFLLPDGETDPYRSEDDQLFLSEIRIPRDGGLIGKTLGDASELKRLRVVGLARAGSGIDLSERPLTAGDRLVVRVTLAELMTLRSLKDIEIGVSMRGPIKQDAEEVVEATIAPNHPSIGHQIREIPFLNINPVRLLGISRQGHEPGPSLTETRIRAADTVLVTGSKQAVRRALHDNPHMISVEKTEGQAFRPAKAPIAIGALVGVVSLSALGILPIMVAGLLAVGLVLVTRCLDGDEAWQSLNGDVLILVYAMLAVGEALDQAGSISMLVGSISPMLENMAPIALLFVIYVGTSALTEAISNNAVAVIMTPVAIGLGVDLGVDPRPLVIAVMFAASASFATPISYQTNTMVYAAGNYRFADFVRIGLPMNAVVGLTTCLTLASLYY